MDLILWRHAQAQDALEAQADEARPLTVKGERQAARMGAWLRDRLPPDARVLVSPTVRTRATARALGRPQEVVPYLLPGTSVGAVLEHLDWPCGVGTRVLVGHQPMLGELLQVLLWPECAQVCTSPRVKKGAVWWLRHDGQPGAPAQLLAVVPADMV